jgi:glutathione S-transferase
MGGTHAAEVVILGGMDLHYGRFSGNSARSLFCLEESGAPYTARALDPKAGENKSASYLGINPMGKIPALTDGEFHLWESNAINWYVAEKFPQAKLLPATPEGRAAVQRWLFFQAAHVSPALAPVLRATHTRTRDYWGFKVDEAAAEAGRKELQRYLPVLEGALADRDWLEGAFSLADIAYAPQSALLLETSFDLSAFPRVRAWMDRLLARPAWQRTKSLIYG